MGLIPALILVGIWIVAVANVVERWERLKDDDDAR